MPNPIEIMVGDKTHHITSENLLIDFFNFLDECPESDVRQALASHPRRKELWQSMLAPAFRDDAESLHWLQCRLGFALKLELEGDCQRLDVLKKAYQKLMKASGEIVTPQTALALFLLSLHSDRFDFFLVTNKAVFASAIKWLPADLAKGILNLCLDQYPCYFFTLFPMLPDFKQTIQEISKVFLGDGVAVPEEFYVLIMTKKLETTEARAEQLEQRISKQAKAIAGLHEILAKLKRSSVTLKSQVDRLVPDVEDKKAEATVSMTSGAAEEEEARPCTLGHRRSFSWS